MIRQQSRLFEWLFYNLNFFRIHVLFFLIAPLISAVIFWAGQDRPFTLSFIDSLFICVSSITCTGLATINLSPLAPWQQSLLFVLEFVGHPVTVSWVMVYIRRSYFRRKFGDVIETRMLNRAAREGISVPPALEEEISRAEGPWRFRLQRLFRRRPAPGTSGTTPNGSNRMNGSGNGHQLKPISSAKIQRLDNPLQRVDPSGWVTAQPSREESHVLSKPISASPLNEEKPPLSMTSPDGSHDQPNAERADKFPRTLTVEFADQRRLPRRPRSSSIGSPIIRTSNGWEAQRTNSSGENKLPASSTGIAMYHTNTGRSAVSRRSTSRGPDESRSQYRGFGGFPGPIEILSRILARISPTWEQQIRERITLPRTETLVSRHHVSGPVPTASAIKHVPYLGFNAIVGRNSVFYDLTQEKLEELGGVEYRALSALLWIVGLYQVMVPLVCFIIIAPYISAARWKSVFTSQPRYVPPPWFALFQALSAYTNTGTSLVDTSMVPFQRAYAMIFPMFVVVFAGNTGYPIFLRVCIWLLSKTVPKQSKANETLHFLLDHPRRTYIYLFPSHQTWFLLTVLVLMVLTDWVCFLVLDIGTPEIASLPLGTRVAVGALQAAAVRAAGFSAIALNSLAPAVKVLYVTMMYIAVYPIALSVRSTNVYEERSLGVFREEDEEDDVEPDIHGPRAKVWGKYLAMHARRQLSYDIWWLGFALWLVVGLTGCLIPNNVSSRQEHVHHPGRGPLSDPDQQTWFNIFSVLFELVSAYGTVGLSLGIPTENYSFSGAFSTLSKLVVIAVMIRGRHRGLPVAIDRAVILKGHDFPDSWEQGDQQEGTLEEDQANLSSRSGPVYTGTSAQEPQSSSGSIALAAHLLDSPEPGVANAERQSPNAQ